MIKKLWDSSRHLSVGRQVTILAALKALQRVMTTRVPPGPPPAAVGDQSWYPKLLDIQVKFS